MNVVLLGLYPDGDLRTQQPVGARARPVLQPTHTFREKLAAVFGDAAPKISLRALGSNRDAHWAGNFSKSEIPLAGLLRLSSRNCSHEWSVLTDLSENERVLIDYYKQWGSACNDFYTLKIEEVARFSTLHALSLRHVRASQHIGEEGFARVSLAKPLFLGNIEKTLSTEQVDLCSHAVFSYGLLKDVEDPPLCQSTVAQSLLHWGIEAPAIERLPVLLLPFPVALLVLNRQDIR